MNRPEREHLRYAHEAAITFHTEGCEISGRTCNVSRGGLCATMAEPIAVGSDIEIDLQLVFDDDQQSEPLRLPARVAWCTPIDDLHQVGIQFLRLDDDTMSYLTMFLRFLGAGSGSRREPAMFASLDDRFG